MTRSPLRALAVVAFVALAGACGGEEEAPHPSTPTIRGRGPVGERAAPPPPIAPTETAGSGTTRRSTRTGTREPPPRLGAAPVAAPIEIEETVEAEAPPERDLGGEVRDAMGSIDGCLDLETARRLAGTLRIPVTAQLLPSGRISSATASGGGLSRTQNACVEDVVEHTSIRGPIEGAPRAVSFTIEMNVEVEEGEETEELGAAWGTPGYVEPGSRP